MDAKRFDEVAAELATLADNIAKLKRPGYTQGNADVLKNFKEGADVCRIHPLQNWGTHFHKQFAAIMSFVTNPNSSKGGESIQSRFADLLNYVLLGYAVYLDSIPQPGTPVDCDCSAHDLNPLGLPEDERPGRPAFLRKIMD